jgi:hypothetical protein
MKKIILLSFIPFVSFASKCLAMEGETKDETETSLKRRKINSNSDQKIGEEQVIENTTQKGCNPLFGVENPSDIVQSFYYQDGRDSLLSEPKKIKKPSLNKATANFCDDSTSERGSQPKIVISGPPQLRDKRQIYSKTKIYIFQADDNENNNKNNNQPSLYLFSPTQSLNLENFGAEEQPISKTQNECSKISFESHEMLQRTPPDNSSSFDEDLQKNAFKSTNRETVFKKPDLPYRTRENKKFLSQSQDNTK